jgi:threonine synthase
MNSVPTGNFGDILAGFYAQQIGLPLSHLIIATNENDILDRFLKTGTYEKLRKTYKKLSQDSTLLFEDVKQTHSPAMDILISSNFERLLYHVLINVSSSREEASTQLNQYMQQLKSQGGFSVSESILKEITNRFSSCKVSNQETLNAITRYYEQPAPYLLDPHTAVGVVAAEKCLNNTLDKKNVQTIILGTASPGKFPEAIFKALPNASLNFEDFAPKTLVNLKDMPKRCIDIVTNGDLKKGIENVKLVIEQLVIKEEF